MTVLIRRRVLLVWLVISLIWLLEFFFGFVQRSIFVQEFSRRDSEIVVQDSNSNKLVRNIHSLAPTNHCRWSVERNLAMVNDDNRTNHVMSSDPKIWGMFKKRCSELDYTTLGQLPRTSVIITFHDSETISSLLHTIHSLVQRTPIELLEEIIVIDDGSSKNDLGQILDIYFNAVFGGLVKLHRNVENVGLIQSRLIGSRLSNGEVIAFFDSHSEVQPRWLEPLLFEIKKNRRTLVSTGFDWMEKKGKTWDYKHGAADWMVIFDWDLSFGWTYISQKENSKRNLTDPIRERAMIGSFTAIDRQFFIEIGELDEGMVFWGGENIDLPIRVWLFGGQVLTVPCSRTAHLEGSDTRKYREPFDSLKYQNYKRVAEVWFDEYKEYSYRYLPNLRSLHPGNLTARFEIKKRALHNFTWYLENIFPELGLPERDGIAWGLLTNAEKQCFQKAEMKACSGVGQQVIENYCTHIYYWTKQLHFRHSMSVACSPANTKIAFQFQTLCKPLKWIHWKNGPMIVLGTKLCLETVPGDLAELRPCNYTKNSNQLWTFENYNPVYFKLIRNSPFIQNSPNMTDISALIRQFLLVDINEKI